VATGGRSKPLQAHESCIPHSFRQETLVVLVGATTISGALPFCGAKIQVPTFTAPFFSRPVILVRGM